MDMTKIQIRGPAIDALDHRKDADNGPTEAQVTKDAATYFKKYGPPDWPEELLHKVYDMGRT